MPDALSPLALVSTPPSTPAVRPSRLAWVDDEAARRRLVWSALLLLHLFALWWLDSAMQPRMFVPPTESDQSLTIRFIDSPEPVALAPPVAPTVSPQTVETPVLSPPVLSIVNTPARAAAPAPASAIADTPQALDSRRLFAPDGSPWLSQQVVDAGSPAREQPGFMPPPRAGLPRIRSPIPYKPTRFDQAWVPDGETLGQEVLRRVTPEREFKTPWGTRWRCKLILVLALCGDVPPPVLENAPKPPWETYAPEPEDPEQTDLFQ